MVLLLMLTSCLTRDERISEFQDKLGLEKAQVLNEMVDHFERSLQVRYSKLELKDAYLQLLEDLEHQASDNTEMLFQWPKALLFKYENSGLQDDFYQQKSNSKTLNEEGVFFKAMRSQSYYDELIAEYFWVLEQTGKITPSQFASGMLRFDFDPNNFFHKRILVFQFSP